MPQPFACLVENPTKSSIIFGGKAINLSALARAQNIDPSYLSRIFSGVRTPRLDYVRRLSAALGMGLEDFLSALDDRIAGLRAADEALMKSYHDRVRKEDESDLRTFSRGAVPEPRLDAMRCA